MHELTLNYVAHHTHMIDEKEVTLIINEPQRK